MRLLTGRAPDEIDGSDGVDILVTIYDNGDVLVALRTGRRWTWGAPVTMTDTDPGEGDR